MLRLSTKWLGRGRAPKLHLPIMPGKPRRMASIAPAVAITAGAGVAFWWWTQWARGRAESEAAVVAPSSPTNGVTPILERGTQAALSESLAVQGDDQAKP